MNASKYAVSAAAASPLVGAIGLAYAQTTTPAPGRNHHDVTTTPVDTATHRPRPPVDDDARPPPSSPAMPAQQTAPAAMDTPASTGTATCAATTDAPMTTERPAQADRN